jgi:hypothetical protein
LQNLLQRSNTLGRRRDVSLQGHKEASKLDDIGSFKSDMYLLELCVGA